MKLLSALSATLCSTVDALSWLCDDLLALMRLLLCRLAMIQTQADAWALHDLVDVLELVVANLDSYCLDLAAAVVVVLAVSLYGWNHQLVVVVVVDRQWTADLSSTPRTLVGRLHRKSCTCHSCPESKIPIWSNRVF